MHDKEEEKKVIRLLKTAKGQIDGLLKMIDEDRYCVDISTQIIATTSILKKVNLEILSGHMNYCVKDAFENNCSDKQEKLDEVVTIVNKLLR